MPSITEGSLAFDFPDGWQAVKFDTWSFYTNQFQKICGSKAVDILAISPDNHIWAIEIKDYRQNHLPKPSDLPETIARKVRDSLAALIAARCNANDEDEKNFAGMALQCSRIHVVLHLEQDRSRSGQQATNPANIKQKLRQLIKAIDPHPEVAEKGYPRSIDWTVRSIKRRS